MTNKIRSATLLILFCFSIVEVAHTDEPKTWIITPTTEGLIKTATQNLMRGVMPSQASQDAAKEAMRQLSNQKEETVAYILRALQLPRSERKPGALAEWKHDTLSSSHYGMVLWSLGPKQLSKLEPTVLNSKDQRVRHAGAVVLGMGKSPTAIELLLTMLKREKSPEVITETLNSLVNNQAVAVSETVLPFLNSKDTKIRIAAIGFFWKLNFKHLQVEVARKPLLSLLKAEGDISVGFHLATTLHDVYDTDLGSLLTHKNLGIRIGAYRCLARKLRVGSRVEDDDCKTLHENLSRESDPRCLYEMAECLRGRKDPSCLPVFIGILKQKHNPTFIHSGTNVKVSALTSLANITKVKFSITDEDRIHRRSKGLYAGCAERYAEWWKVNRKRIHWDSEQHLFVVVQKRKKPNK